jgi:hypothetical protein
MYGIRSSPQRRSAAPFAGRFVWLIGALCSGLMVAACGEEPEETPAAAEAPAPRIAIYQLDRLKVTDHVAPEQWLASRQSRRDMPEDHPNVTRIKHTLDVASRRFHDRPRMIANRAVQLEEMLMQKKLLEPAVQLIARLSRVPGETPYVESFGAICQQYFNLRMQGLDQEEALNVLKIGAHASN